MQCDTICIFTLRVSRTAKTKKIEMHLIKFQAFTEQRSNINTQKKNDQIDRILIKLKLL